MGVGNRIQAGDGMSAKSKQPRTFWTPAQLKLLRKHYPHKRTEDLVKVIGRDLRSIYAKAAELQIRKSAAFLASPASGRTSGRQGIGTRFEKGNSAWNKGLKGIDIAGPRGRATQFKPGSRPHNWQPIGHERVTDDGIKQRKMTDTGVTGADYVPLHVLLWIEHNGPFPSGSIIAFKDKDRNNITIENLECLTRAQLMLRNSYHTRYPKEVANLIQLRGALQRQINRREKDGTHTAE